MAWNKYSEYIIFDAPVPYQRAQDTEPLLLYPVRMRDIIRFNYFSACLLVDKNSIPDGKIISMGNLEYLYHATITDVEHTPYILMFRELLKICLNKRSDKESTLFSFNTEFKKPFFFKIGDVTYQDEDYMEIRRIIAEQNLLELPEDSPYGKRTRELLEEARAMKAKINGTKMCSLEDQMVALSIATGLKLEDIYDMPVRKFSKSIERVDHKLTYELTTLLSPYMDGKNKIENKHWLADLSGGNKYDDVLVGLQEIEDKVNGLNGSN